MKINILTLFPDMFTPLKASMTGRAEEAGLLEYNIVDIRKYSLNKHKKADDYPFGGGQGMVLMAEPVFRAMESLGGAKTRNIYMSPKGKLLTGEMAEEFSHEDECTILCGHYEGIDQRVIDYWHMEEVSIGDYILTGGELPAMVFIDVISRLVPGVLSSEESAVDESIYSGLLEYPHYTQPRSYRGLDVPEVLLSGDHRKIHLWRYAKALELTRERRPDLFRSHVAGAKERLAKDEWKLLEKFLP